MRNLSEQEKKLISKIALIIGGVLLLWLLYVGANALYEYKISKFIEQKKELIEMYQKKIDSIEDINKKLYIKIDQLDRDIDSLQNTKVIIYKEYDKKINIIYDASAADHAKWMESILLELKADKQLNK